MWLVVFSLQSLAMSESPSLLNQQEFIRILNWNAMAGRVGVVEINVNGLKEKDQVTECKKRAMIFQSDW